MRPVNFKNTETVKKVEFIDKMPQRVKLDSLRMASAVADEEGNIPVYEMTLIGYFRTFFTLASVNGEDMKDLHKRLRLAKEPRKEIVVILEEKKWEDDWEIMGKAYRELFNDDEENPEVAENAKTFLIEKSGSGTPTESPLEQESSDSSKQGSPAQS